MVLDEMAEEAIKQIKNEVYWLTNALDKQDDVNALKYREKVEPLVADLKVKYSSLQKSIDCINEVDKVLLRLDNELGDIIANKEIKVVHSF